MPENADPQRASEDEDWVVTALRLKFATAPFDKGIHRVEVQAAVHNVASRHVAEVAGCQFEGIIRHGENLRGKRHDLAVYAKLATD